MKRQEMKTTINPMLLFFMTILFVSSSSLWAMDLHTWSESEKAVLKSLWIGSLPPISENPSNKYAADPRAVVLGKAIAAFVRTIVPTPSRFDNYVEALMANDPESMIKALTNEEVKGLRLFIGKAKPWG
jgi:hypothetical protein